MSTLAADDARMVARNYYQLATAVGAFRFANWTRMTKRDRDRLESLEWTLLTDSSDFTTHAINLAVDDLQAAVADIGAATIRLRRAVERTDRVRTAIGIATTAVSLGAALVTGNAGAIAEALADATTAATAG